MISTLEGLLSVFVLFLLWWGHAQSRTKNQAVQQLMASEERRTREAEAREKVQRARADAAEEQAQQMLALQAETAHGEADMLEQVANLQMNSRELLELLRPDAAGDDKRHRELVALLERVSAKLDGLKKSNGATG